MVHHICGKIIINTKAKYFATIGQIILLVQDIEAVLPEKVSQSASCLPDVDCPRTFTARNAINDVITHPLIFARSHWLLYITCWTVITQ